MNQNQDLCQLCTQLGKILAGRSECRAQEQICTVSVDRTNLGATILRRQSKASEVQGIALLFEGPDEQGRTLNLVEATLLEEEVNPFVKTLQRFGILVTAIHNHWLLEKPRLIYVHGQAVSDPTRFAQAVKAAIDTLVIKPKVPSPTTT